MKYLKKATLAGILILAVVIIMFVLLRDNTELKRENSTLELEKQVLIDNTDTYEYLNSITIDNFENKVKNKENILVYIGNSLCSDCSKFSKTLKDEVENFPLKNSLYLVEITNLHKNKKQWLAFKERYGFDQTPAFILFEKGEIKTMIQWNEKSGLSPESFHKWLEENRSDIEKL
ncbi:DUF6568 family protein [Enterococcus sp. RIT-PI-f]|uniref:DUF6568 family protein n=1 Tax=Enterococcus sp. RIT-PI-f TaxID=1690244 RepID=UPI003562A7C8